MKSKINKTVLYSLVLFLCMTAFFTSCSDYTGKYEMTDGIPTIHYIRYQGVDQAGQLLDGALMGDQIVIIGDNLTSVQEVWFNNVMATLNVNLITKNALFVNVPKDLPSEKTDKIYFVTGKKDTVTYDFQVRIPAPSIDHMKCEYLPEGADVVLIGDYFFATDPSLMKVFVGDYQIPTADIVSYEKTKLVFKAPPMNIKGPIEVKTLYGNSGRTQAVFRDDRGMITTFDSDYPVVPGWGVAGSGIESDPLYALTGNYLVFAGEIKSTNVGPWGQMDATMTLHYWGEDNGKPTGNLFPSDPKTSTLKFEVNVVRPWSALAMQFFFGAQGMTNGPMWNNSWPVGLWRPWLSGADVVPYKTDGWITVSMPLSDFVYDNQGGTSMLVEAMKFPPAFGALTVVVFRGGVEGLACDPLILIDNIRVVP